MKFLVDECLSPTLVSVANDAGYEAYHVAYRGWSGKNDPELFRRLVEEELVLVTNNRDDFLALTQGVDLHPGLIVLVENVRREYQAEMFRHALKRAAALGSLINRVIEVSVHGNVAVHELPAL